MARGFAIKQGSTGPAIQGVCLDGARKVVDLTLATAVRFRMRPNSGSAYTVDAAAAFVSPRTAGGVVYDWADGDTDVAGDYQGDFLVTFPGRTEVYPTDNIPIVIEPALVGVGP